MLKTRLCELLVLEVPIILAAMGTCTSAELAAAVSNEGGLGGIGSLFRPTATVKRDIDVVKTLTQSVCTRHMGLSQAIALVECGAVAQTTNVGLSGCSPSRKRGTA